MKALRQRVREAWVEEQVVGAMGPGLLVGSEPAGTAKQKRTDTASPTADWNPRPPATCTAKTVRRPTCTTAARSSATMATGKRLRMPQPTMSFPFPTFRQRHPAGFAGLAILAMCFAQTFFLATPVYAGLMAEHWGWTPPQIGLSATAEILGNAVGSLVVAFALSRQPVRGIVLGSLLLVLVANAWMATAPGPLACAVARAVSGLGTGALSSLVFRFLSEGERADRQIGAAILGQNLYSMLLMMAVLPAIGSPSSAIWMICGLAALSTPVLLLFGRDETVANPQADGHLPVQRLGAYVGLMSLLLLYAGVGVVWTFLDERGRSLGMTEHQLSWVLGGGTAVSLVGCFLAPRAIAAGHRYGATVAIVLACAAAAWVLSSQPLSPALFTVATIGFLICWNAAAILLFATVPLYDPVGQHVAMAPGFLGLGYAIGTMLGAYMLDDRAPELAFLTAAGWCLLAALCYAALRVMPPQPRPFESVPEPSDLPHAFR